MKFIFHMCILERRKPFSNWSQAWPDGRRCCRAGCRVCSSCFGARGVTGKVQTLYIRVYIYSVITNISFGYLPHKSSHRHGRRKPCMLIPIFGELVTSIGLILCTYFDGAPMEVAGATETLFPGITGIQSIHIYLYRSVITFTSI